jgi:hypothetical protein
LRNFTSYTQVIGGTAPPHDEVLSTFEITAAWSAMRTASQAWDAYARDQEGLCWRVIRPAMESLKGAFDLAAARDASLVAKFAGLAALLGTRQSIAKKAVATKRLNKKDIQEGKQPTHGAVVKRRKKASDKANADTANASNGTTPTPSAPAAQPAAGTNGAVAKPQGAGTNGSAASPANVPS